MNTRSSKEDEKEDLFLIGKPELAITGTKFFIYI